MIERFEYPKLTPGKNLDGKINTSSILVFVKRTSLNLECIFKNKYVSGIIKDNLPRIFKTEMHLNKNKEYVSLTYWPANFFFRISLFS